MGSSTLRVSEIALGSWLTYSGGVARDRSVACIDRALGLGINLIDRANVYGRGAAETLLGEMLRGRSRESGESMPACDWRAGIGSGGATGS